jgi:hypothetical protein
MAGELAANGKLPTTDKILTLCVYPADRTELTAYYAASFLLTQFLEERGGRPQLFEFVADAERDGWEIAARKRYRFADLQDLDSAWRRWLTQSSSEHVAAVSDSGG